MRFSGHETFCVREGWLHKGLSLLLEDPDRLYHEHAADFLGVGSNMAKSIRHWLQATGLAEPDPKGPRRLSVTRLGRLINKHDQYFMETDTWWLLHVNLVNRPIYADTWNWSFNSFNLETFDRSILLENLRQYVQLSNWRMPSMKTLERDVACLLSSYSRNIPSDNSDPEEARDCPFRDLGLLSHYRSSGFYRFHHNPKRIHPAVFGYCVCRAFEDAGQGDITISRLLREPGGPGRAFALTGESLYETLVHIVSEDDKIRIQDYAGQRAVSLPRRSLYEWAKLVYHRRRRGVRCRDRNISN